MINKRFDLIEKRDIDNHRSTETLRQPADSASAEVDPETILREGPVAMIFMPTTVFPTKTPVFIKKNTYWGLGSSCLRRPNEPVTVTGQ